MPIVDTIQQHVEQLPIAFQQEVLDFTTYLLTKSIRQEDHQWSECSLSFAMRGMEQEITPHYTLDDVKVVFF